MCIHCLYLENIAASMRHLRTTIHNCQSILWKFVEKGLPHTYMIHQFDES